MARPLRIEVPNGVYHVTSRGLERREIVRDERDGQKWLDLLDSVARRRRWRVFAWVLMPNHFHLFLETPDADLSAGMHDLNAGYASAFNRRHGRCGPLFQGRFKAILVEHEYHYWELSRYIHLNPVRAGLAARPQDYPWGSCRDYLGMVRAPVWVAWEDVLREHGRTLEEAREGYARFLAEGVERPPVSPMWGVVAGVVLGSGTFVARVMDWLAGQPPKREVPAARALRRAVGVEAIEGAVCEVFGVAEGRLRERGRWGNEARAAALYLCRKWTGMTVRELGERFGGVGAPAVTKMATQLARELDRDRELAERIDRCEAELGLEKGKSEDLTPALP